MATREPAHNPIRRTPRNRGWRRVAVTALLAASVRSVVLAEPAVLMANPGGSLTIESQPMATPAQTGADGASGDLVGPPGVAPETPPADSTTPPAPRDPVDTAVAEASKPLGAITGPIVGSEKNGTKPSASGGGWGVRTALALAAVLGLIVLCKLAFVRVTRRGGGTLASQLGASGRAPSGLLSVLARYPIARGSTLVLLRLDRRVLLLSQTGQGFTTLAEIDDPEEVATLIMRAEDEEGASLTRRFRTLLTQSERDPGLIGAVDPEFERSAPMTPRAATARFNELATDPGIHSPAHDGDLADAVGSLRNRLRTMREVTA
jgi:flagellar biogenesis protein FliO